jgi:hypothetical protein
MKKDREKILLEGFLANQRAKNSRRLQGLQREKKMLLVLLDLARSRAEVSAAPAKTHWNGRSLQPGPYSV